MLFSTAMSSAQPVSTRQPTPTMKRLIPLDNDLKEEVELDSAGGGGFILVIYSSSNLNKEAANLIYLAIKHNTILP